MNNFQDQNTNEPGELIGSEQLLPPNERQLNGLLVSYLDDELNECVNSALKRKSRVKYKCMDVFLNYLAFGTTGGAIYLFKLKHLTHSSCELVFTLPCDQGSIEVIKFVFNSLCDDLLIAIGTSRGSLLVFRLTQMLMQNGNQSVQFQEQPQANCHEIYRAEDFTPSNSSIKLIEYDQNLLDAGGPVFTRLYVCDSANRLYSLESSCIYQANKRPLSLFGPANRSPSLVFSVKDSNINQISVYKSQLLISTDETTRYFNEQTNQLSTIGKRKRREGFYGACFFNPTYKPAKLFIGNNSTTTSSAQRNSNFSSFANSQQTIYSSTNSIGFGEGLENLFVFVARPMFRLWQVSNKREVMFTHQFEPLIKSCELVQIVNLQNFPLKDEDEDEPEAILEAFATANKLEETTQCGGRPHQVDHFQKLIPIYSATLGNLLLSYTQNELFVVDPIRARLIVWHKQRVPIIAVCCQENEIIIWSSASGFSGEPTANEAKLQQQQQQRTLTVSRLVLLAPTQFVLELHRLHRYLSLISFVQLFCEQFRRVLALPLTGMNLITTEGGLLRNILLNAWQSVEARATGKEEAEGREALVKRFEQFREIVEEIVGESKNLKKSLTNLTDSRFFLTMTNENLERLCCEPYTSLVSLEVSIANLHTNHMIHFSREALNRHKSAANLAQSVKNLNQIRQAKSSLNLVSNGAVQRRLPLEDDDDEDSSARGRSELSLLGSQEAAASRYGATVLVERQKPNKTLRKDGDGDEQVAASQKSRPFFSVRGRQEAQQLKEDVEGGAADEAERQQPGREKEEDSVEQLDKQAPVFEVDLLRCPSCKWPRARSHLRPMHSSQQIQLNWIRENLMENFEENVDEIEERSLKHSLWHLLLNCLAFRNKLDDYITCCIMLDDIRLLNIEQFFITRRDEDEIIDRVLVHLGRKIEFDKEEGNGSCCFKCKGSLELPLAPKQRRAARRIRGFSDLGGFGSDFADDDDDDDYEDDDEEDVSFSLVNLFEQFMMRRNADVKKAISRLLRHPKLLNSCRIPAKFYLRVIASYSSSSGGYNFGN